MAGTDVNNDIESDSGSVLKLDISSDGAILDCLQSPIFPWDFRDSEASIELPPSLFVRGSATWEECLKYRGGREWGGGGKNRETVTASH